MALIPVDEAEVARVIQGLSTKKSCDHFGMSVWLLKRCLKHLLCPLVKLINSSFESGHFPIAFKTAKVIPIFKKDDPTLANNYRPISILPVLSKVFEKAFLNRLTSFLNTFDVLSPHQFGFRKNKSTIDAITNLVELVVDGLERREQVISIFLDLSKAFDCVHHETLLHELDKCGVRGLPHKWLSSYLRDREQCVQIAHVSSEKAKMPFGVPQGSILGPTLFLIYVDKLNLSIHNGKIIQYADDTTLLLNSSNIHDLEVNAFVELNSCIKIFSEINLKTNSSKSNFVNFCLRQQERRFHPNIMIDEVVIDEVESTKFLGMHLDKGLTWNNHIDSICSKVTSGIFALRSLAKTCSPDVLKMAYFGLIYPHLVYGLRLWGGCSKFKFERIFRLQKQAVRIVSKLKFRESCRDAFRELRFFTLPCLYVLEVILYCKSRYVFEINHCYETRGRDNFRVQRHRTKASERLPSYVGVKLVNRLPEGIKLLNDNLLKAQLKELLVSNAFYSVDEFLAHRWEI